MQEGTNLDVDPMTYERASKWNLFLNPCSKKALL